MRASATQQITPGRGDSQAKADERPPPPSCAHGWAVLTWHLTAGLRTGLRSMSGAGQLVCRPGQMHWAARWGMPWRLPCSRPPTAPCRCTQSAWAAACPLLLCAVKPCPSNRGHCKCRHAGAARPVPAQRQCLAVCCWSLAASDDRPRRPVRSKLCVQLVPAALDAEVKRAMAASMQLPAASASALHAASAQLTPGCSAERVRMVYSWRAAAPMLRTWIGCLPEGTSRKLRCCTAAAHS